MRPSSKPLPKDPRQLACEVVELPTEGQQSQRSAAFGYLAQIARTGRLKGGKARPANLSGKEPNEIATEAAIRRWMIAKAATQYADSKGE
jgi:hypothetical protein